MGNPKNITLRQLETFLELAQSGTFGAAAARLGIGQPSLSRNITRLENELGVEIIKRHSKGGTLTQKGVRLNAVAATFLKALQGIADPEARLDRDGNLTIGVPQNISGLVIPKIFKALIERFPKLKPNFSEAPSHELEQATEADRIDVALLYDPPRIATRLDVPLVDEGMMVIASPSWEWPEPRQFVTIRDLTDIPVILLQSGHSERRTLAKAERQQGIQIKPLLEIGSPSTLKSLVNSGVGFSVASALGVTKELAAGSLQAWPLGSPGVKTRLFLSMTTETQSSTMSRDLREIVSKIVVAATQKDPNIMAVRLSGSLPTV